MKVRYGDRYAYARGLVGLAPEEPQVTGVDRALRWGTWFESEREEGQCLLPDALAEALGIPTDEPARAEVTIFGRPYRVRGVFESEAFSRIRDLDDEPLTPAKQKVAQSLMPGRLFLACSFSPACSSCWALIFYTCAIFWGAAHTTG